MRRRRWLRPISSARPRVPRDLAPVPSLAAGTRVAHTVPEHTPPRHPVSARAAADPSPGSPCVTVSSALRPLHPPSWLSTAELGGPPCSRLPLHNRPPLSSRTLPSSSAPVSGSLAGMQLIPYSSLYPQCPALCPAQSNSSEYVCQAAELGPRAPGLLGSPVPCPRRVCPTEGQGPGAESRSRAGYQENHVF